MIQGLAKAVKETLKEKSVIDAVSQRKLDSVRELTAKSCNIQSVEGLQHFTDLRELYLSANKINDISPLKDLIQLKGV